MTKISKVLFQTHKTRLDAYVIDMIKSMIGYEWEYKFFNDDDIIHFFINNPIADLPDIIKKYNSILKGAHKADLFRYYYLYVNGGFFMDSDAMLYVDIETIVKDYDFVSVNSSCHPGTIFQGILGASPKNEIIKKALYKAYDVHQESLNKNYHFFCKQLYDIVNENDYGNTIKLYQERRLNPNEGDDILDEGKVLFKHFWKDKIIPVLNENTLNCVQTKCLYKKNKRMNINSCCYKCMKGGGHGPHCTSKKLEMPTLPILKISNTNDHPEWHLYYERVYGHKVLDEVNLNDFTWFYWYSPLGAIDFLNIPLPTDFIEQPKIFSEVPVNFPFAFNFSENALDSESFYKAGFFVRRDINIDIFKNPTIEVLKTCKTSASEIGIARFIFTLGSGFHIKNDKSRIVKNSTEILKSTDNLELFKIAPYDKIKESGCNILVITESEKFRNQGLIEIIYCLNDKTALEDKADITMFYGSSLHKVPYIQKYCENTKLLKYHRINFKNLANFKYSWGSSSITFLENGQMDAFGKGNYMQQDTNIFKAHFGGRSHLLVFNDDFTEYTSTRIDDGDTHNGKIIIST